MARFQIVLVGGLAAALCAACRSPVQTAAVPDRHAAADSVARAAIANERSISVTALPARSVGVAPLSVSASDTLIAPLGYGLADLLITDLSRSAQLQVVDRLQLDAMLRELKLAGTGRVDTLQAPRIGKLVGARRITIGALTQLPGNGIRIDARVADIATQRVGGAISATAPLDQILDAEKQLAFKFFDLLGVTLTPAERAAVEERPTKNIGALLAFSRGVRDEATGSFDAARAEYQQAVRLDPSFSLAASHLGGLSAGIGAAVRPGVGGLRLLHATRFAAGELNRSLVDRLVAQHPELGGVADAAFSNAAAVVLLIQVRVLP
jgi:TolB-like protein